MANINDEYCICFNDVEEASKRIQGFAHRTPVIKSQSVDRIALCHVLFKVEAMQKTGSFKFRGATNAVQNLLNKDPNGRGDSLQVVTHSSGNHAQALALASQLSSTESCPITATIVMPESTPAVKKAAVLGYGGIPVMTGNSNEARESKADEIMKETGAHFIHPSEDPLVIAGQGTVCYELVEQAKQDGITLDTVVIPVGGGGLAAGNTVALRGMLGDSVRIILAEPEEMDDAKRSFDSKQLLQHAPDNKLNSVADGLKTTLGPNTFPIIRDMVDDIMTVSELDILRSTKLIWERLKVTIEPSAGVGVAVVCSDEFHSKYPDAKNVGVVLCGGNVDVIQIASKMQELGV